MRRSQEGGVAGGTGGAANPPAIVETGDFGEAVRLAYAGATSGTTVLLSPACASFDLFRNYEARGEAFREVVRALTEEEQ